MARSAVIIVGHSHMSSIVSALHSRPGESYCPDEGAEYYVFNTIKYGSEFQFSKPDAAGNYVLNDDLVNLINSRIPSYYDRLFVSMFGGNAHNALTLLEHPQPFDFILPERPDYPRLTGARLLPYELVKSFIKEMAKLHILNMATLRNAFSDPVIHIESPPPIGDNDFILSNIDQYFKDQSSNPKIAPRDLRYKLWRLHSDVIRSAAGGLGIDFIEAPKESYDAETFLVPDDYGNDATHAGPSYGLRIMKQIEANLNARYGGWNWL